jgi:uncharacterized protein (TIGR02453 family)
VPFRGWPVEAIEFYEGLCADNSKAYWTAHKDVYDACVRAPMTELLAELEAEFGAGKIFRPYRDVRFSADKTPYKTQIAATLERGGYLRLSADGLGVGSGAYHLETPAVQRFRAAIDDERTGSAFVAVAEQLRAAGITVDSGDRLKREPPGFDGDHPRADLLRWKNVVAWREWPVAAWLGTPKAKERVVETLRATAPLRDWLAHVV